MTQYDDLVAKYRNLSYGRLSGGNPSSINSLLAQTDRSLSSPNYFGNIPTEDTQYVETPSGFIAQNQFQIDPITGIPVFKTPTSEATNQGILMGGGTPGSGAYDPNIDYGDPGFADAFRVNPNTGMLGTSQEVKRTGGGDGRQEMINRRMGTLQRPFQNTDYKGIVGGDFKDVNVGDKFTYSKDLKFGEAYDEYGRKRTSKDFKTFTGASYNPIDAFKDFFGIGKEDKKDLPSTSFDSGYQSTYDPDIKGSGGFQGPGTTGPVGPVGKGDSKGFGNNRDFSGSADSNQGGSNQGGSKKGDSKGFGNNRDFSGGPATGTSRF